MTKKINGEKKKVRVERAIKDGNGHIKRFGESLKIKRQFEQIEAEREAKKYFKPRREIESINVGEIG